MEIKFEGNNQLHNVQMGDNNYMYISDSNWDELKSFADKKSSKEGISKKDASELSRCVKNHDTQGLKKILTGEKKNFLMNVLASSVSSGLFMALEMLCGI